MSTFSSICELLQSDTLNEFLRHPSSCSQEVAIQILRCALLCADEGGSMIRKAISTRVSSASQDANTKVSAADLVTETDLAVEKLIRNRINKTFTDHLFVGEEGSGASITVSEREGKFVWIVDPIDGTTNFVHAFPVVAVSIAVAFGDKPILGLIYNPLTNELWFAWKGCGAFMKQANGSLIPIATSGCKSLSSAIVSTGFAVPAFRRETANVAAKEKLQSIVEHNTRVLMTRSRDIRRIGSAACDICYVAMGRTDVYFEFGIKEWDIAAGLVILSEAGGDSSTVGGNTQYSIRGRNILVAASTELRLEMNSVLRDEGAVESIEQIEA
jgi:myo-inositol-1(or 4)-monophosphatase